MRTKNEWQNFESEFLMKIKEKEAWKNISANENLPWSLDLIEKYADKLDWKALCANRGITWDVEMIEKFKQRIDWDMLSETILGGKWTAQRGTKANWDIFEKFERYWNWHELSKTECLIPDYILEQFADNWDWKELITNRYIKWSYSHFEKFKRYIPLNDFEALKESALWISLISIDEQIITGKMLASL
jgi:hypothetical protein